MSRAEKFLESFREIEQILGRSAEADADWDFHYTTFMQLVRKSGILDKEIVDDLREFAQLRNAIIHQSRRRCIAEPDCWVVERIQKISVLLRNPPKIKYQEPETVAADDTIETAIAKMRERSFSQVPVCRERVASDLLTAETVARWLGTYANSHGRVDLGTPVSEVLGHSEGRNNWAFLRRNASQFDLVRLFRTFEQRGIRLDAVLVTETGASTQRLIGILTVWDLERAYRELQVSGSAVPDQTQPVVDEAS